MQIQGLHLPAVCAMQLCALRRICMVGPGIGRNIVIKGFALSITARKNRAPVKA
jgi:hypothetical protein